MRLNLAPAGVPCCQRRRVRMLVADPGMFDHLIKEAELLSGVRGRVFFLGRDDRLAYRVTLEALGRGYEVQLFDGARPVLRREYVARDAMATAIAANKVVTWSLVS